MALMKANVDAVTRFASNLRKADPQISKALRTGIRDGGNLIRDTARQNASFSAKIPRTIRVSVSGTTAVIRAGNAAVPEAVLWERPGGWRHPLFGSRKHWYDEGPHRYLHPALDSDGPKAKAIIASAVMAAVDEVVDG